MATHESRVKDQIKRVLKSKGIWYFMPVSNGMGKHGVPDFICCMKGKFLGIEAKAEGGSLSKHQEICISEIRQAGGLCGVVVGVEKAKDLEWQLDMLLDNWQDQEWT